MPPSVFDNPDHQPTAKDLKKSLTKSYDLWTTLKSDLIATYPPLAETWKFTGKSTGWGMRLVQKDRVVVYMTPNDGYFLFSIVLGEKAFNAAHELKLPANIIKTIDAAKKYAKGYGIRFEIHTAKDAKGLPELVGVKVG